MTDGLREARLAQHPYPGLSWLAAPRRIVIGAYLCQRARRYELNCKIVSSVCSISSAVRTSVRDAAKRAQSAG